MEQPFRSRCLTVITALLVWLSLSTAIQAQFFPVYVGPVPNIDFKVGRVMARSIVLDPQTGKPILVEFDIEGKEVNEVELGGNSVDDLAVVPAADYRFFKLQLSEFKDRHRDDLAKGAELLTRQEYEQTTFSLLDNQTTINKLPLAEGVNSVFVRGQTNRIINDPKQLILLKFSLDMTQDISVTDSNVSLVVNGAGQIIANSDNNIGYRTGFFGDPNEPQNDRRFRVLPDDEIFGPITGVKVSVDDMVYPGGVDITDDDGKYSFIFHMPLCPIGGFSFTTDVWAELRYKNFLPTGSPSIPYYLRTPGYSYCYADLVPAIIAPTIIGILASIAVPNIQSNLYADVMFVTGNIVIKNSLGENVEIGNTTYTSFEEDANNTIQKFYDFNGDGENDFVLQGRVYDCTNTDNGEEIRVFRADGSNQQDPEGYQCSETYPDDSGEGNRQAIFFDGAQDDEFDFPDLIRIVDQELRDEPIGVLKGISTADLRNTDVLFFRESTGQLIMERRGLKEAEANYRRAIEYDQEENEVAYRVMLRGRSDSRLNIGGGIRRNQSYEDWATEYQLEEPFRARESDHPRPGEFIKIVAINRATGYTGTARVQLKSAGDNGTGLLDVPAPQITMQPPNLKIWAERVYEVEKGLTEGEERTYTIGNEGASLTSDTIISIYTEWLDEHGKPLPDELGRDDGEEYGLTGRLAKVVGANQLQGVSAGSDLAEFPIAPGRNTQVIRVKDNLTTADHFYVHVIGKPKDQECVNNSSCPSFSQTGSEAPYDSRPQLLTPFLTPLPNEDQQWQEYNAYRELLDEFEIAENTNEESKPIKPLPAYVWQYRPEYQFSQFDLEINAINISATGANSETEVINILDDPTPNIPGGDEMLSVLYSLITSEQSRLTPIDGERQLVLAVGETEMILTIRADGSIIFSDLGSLAGLEPEDFLSIRIYANNDSANILWEFAFGSVSIGTDLNRDGKVNLVVRTQLSENALSDVTSGSKPFRFWLNNDFDVVNDSGVIELEMAECPIFTGNQVCEQWDESTDKGTNIDSDKLNYIESNRDLEDFAPLAIRLIAEHGQDGYIKLDDGMTAEIKAVGLSINLFQGEWEEGTDYLTDSTKLNKQMENQAKEKYLFELKGNAEARQLTQNDLNKMFDREDVAKLIFEGTSKSSLDCVEDATNCYVEFTIKRGGTIISTDKVYMVILPVKHYYDHFTVGKGLLTGLQAVATNAHPEFQFKPLLIAEDPDVEKLKDDYIMMVHGWRMQYEERVQFAETAFKRLYWSGYKGRYGFFSWPTGWFEKPAHIYREFPKLGSDNDVLDFVGGNEQNYGDSEAFARASGNRLGVKLLGLSSTYPKIHIFAHSMGNVVVTEALRNAQGSPLVKHYIASQAATVASAYYNQVPFIRHKLKVGTSFTCADEGGFSGPENTWRCYNQNGLDTEFDMPPNHYSYTIPALHGATSPSLETMVAQRDGWGPHYYNNVEQSAEQIINFFNVNDIALNGWEFNQLTKPDLLGGPTWEYDFNWDCPYSFLVCAADVYPDDEDGEVVTDTYTSDTLFTFEKQYLWDGTAPINEDSAQILGHIIPSRSFALGQGAVSRNGTSEISDNNDFSAYGSHNQAHSAQFYNTYFSRMRYWDNIMIEFRLKDE